MKRIAWGLLVAVGVLVAQPLIINAATEDAKLFELNPSAGMRDVLAENIGKQVALTLVNGSDVEGTIKSVGLSLVHVTRLSGREFFDAVVSIDKIASVRMRMRDK